MAGDPSAECLRQLREFEATLTHAETSSHLHEVYYRILSAVRGLLIDFALLFLIQIIWKSVKRFQDVCCKIILSALENVLVVERCTVEKCEISDQMQLFWEVYQLKVIPNLVDSSTLSALDKMLESVEAHIKEIDKNGLSQLRVPSELLCLFNVEEWDASTKCSSKEPCFSRMFPFSTVDRVKLSKVSQELERILHYASNEALDGVGAGNSVVESMKKLSDFRLETCLPFDDAMQLAYRFTSVLGKLSSWQCDKMEAFLAMFENFFQSLSEESRSSVVRLVYEKHLPKDDGCLIFLGNNIRSYSTDVTKCVNGIGDHNENQSHPEKFNDIRKKLSWYLFTVPGPTLRRLLSQCLQNKSIVPGVLNILRSCRVLFEFTVKSDKVLGVEYSPILIESIMILFDDEIDGTERLEQFVYLLTSLCRDKRGNSKDRPVTAADKAIMKAGVLVRLFVLPNLMQRTHKTVMLRLLQRAKCCRNSRAFVACCAAIDGV